MTTLLINMIVSPQTNTLIEFTSNPDTCQRSCDACRKRKIKCDRKANFCSQCFKNGTLCTYKDPIRKRGRPAKLNVDMKPYLSPRSTTSSFGEEDHSNLRVASSASNTPIGTPSTGISSNSETFEAQRFTLPPIHFLEQPLITHSYAQAEYNKNPFNSNDLSKYSLKSTAKLNTWESEPYYYNHPSRDFIY